MARESKDDGAESREDHGERGSKRGKCAHCFVQHQTPEGEEHDAHCRAEVAAVDSDTEGAGVEDGEMSAMVFAESTQSLEDQRLRGKKEAGPDNQPWDDCSKGASGKGEQERSTYRCTTHDPRGEKNEPAALGEDLIA